MAAEPFLPEPGDFHNCPQCGRESYSHEPGEFDEHMYQHGLITPGNAHLHGEDQLENMNKTQFGGHIRNIASKLGELGHKIARYSPKNLEEEMRRRSAEERTNKAFDQMVAPLQKEQKRKAEYKKYEQWDNDIEFDNIKNRLERGEQ